MTSVYEARKIKKFRALRDYVIVENMNFDQKLSHGGIIIPHSDGKLEGVHPRWGKVYAVGPKQTDVKVGQYVCVKHGRWTRGSLIEDDQGERIIRRIDPADILLISDYPMVDETIGRGL